MRKVGGVSTVLFVFIVGGVHVPTVFAQSDLGYQIGDRIEADPTDLSPGPYKRWTKATVVGVVRNGYAVLLDGPLPRSVNVVGYGPNYSRRIAGHVVPPTRCRLDGESSAAMESLGKCWDSAAVPQGMDAAQGGVHTPPGQRQPQVSTANGANVGVAAPVGSAQRVAETQGFWRVGDVVEIKMHEGWQRATVLEVHPDWGFAYKLRLLSGPDKGTTSLAYPSDVRASGAGPLGATADKQPEAPLDGRRAATDWPTQLASCSPGTKALYEGKPVTLLKTDAEHLRFRECRVELASGAVQYTMMFGLQPAVGVGDASTLVGPLTGTYHCLAANGVAGTLTLVIKSRTAYADGYGGTGTYTFDPETHKIAFPSGPWKGFYGEKLSARQIGIASRPGGFYNTVCDL